MQRSMTLLYFSPGSQDKMTCMAICTQGPAPERFVAAKQDDVQMQPGGLIQ